MSKSPDQSQLRRENDRPPPPQSAAALVAPNTSSRAPPQKTTSSSRETHITKALGFPLRSTFRDSEDPIPPPPNDDVRDAPAANSPHRSLKENSVDSALRFPLRRSEIQVPVPIPQANKETSIPMSPPASQQPLSSQNANASKSPGRDETVNVTHHQLGPEDAGSPMLQMDRSLEKSAVANRMAAPGSTMAAKVGRGGVNGMRVESGVVRWAAMRRAEFGLRVLEVILCMISFSVMAADKTSGWAGDSFDRYQEFRYCISMNVIAFVYAGFQVYAQFHHRMKKRRIIDRPLSYYLDFSMDQVLAYLLMSASSSATTRNDDWISMFGSDKFTDKMNGSIAMSFLAFFAFAVSSIISADKLFSWKL